MAIDTIRIEKFDGRNSFALWQLKMRALLKERCIWKPLTPGFSTKVKKTEAAAAGVAATVTETEDPALVTMEERAHSSILLSLSDDVTTRISPKGV